MPDTTLTVFRETYQSQLGQFELRLQTTNTLFRVEVKADGFSTVGHNVVIRKVTTLPRWLPSGMEVEAATAWLFYIVKRNSSGEQLTFSMEALPSTDIQGTTDTGQYLWAVEFENDVRQVHIGTEDEEAMGQRAHTNNWMPPRLGPLLDNYKIQVTTLTPNKLSIYTQIPQLHTDEQFYFHYILAENPCRESMDYPGERDITTWIAVGQPKHKLEQAWQEQKRKLQS